MDTSQHRIALDALHSTLGSRHIIFAAFHGSHLYGTATPTSDLDVRAVFLPTPEEILLGHIDFTIDNNTDKKRLGPKDIDIVAFSFARFLRLLGKFDGNAIEMLFASQQGTPTLLKSDEELMTRVRTHAHQLIATSGSSPIGHARSILGALAPNQDSYIDALQAGVQILTNAKTKEDPEGKHTKLYTVPNLLATLRTLPGATYRAHGHNADTTLLEKDIPQEAITTGRWKEHTLFVSIADRMLSTTMTIHEAETVLRKPLKRLQGEIAARRARMENVAVSPKDMYHALRVLWQFVEIAQTGSLTFPRPEAKTPQDVRNGLITGPDLQNLIDTAFKDAMSAKNKPMPFADTPHTAIRDSILIDAHRQVVLSSI